MRTKIQQWGLEKRAVALREKAECDRLAKIARDEQEETERKAREEAKRLEIEEMRKQVAGFDRNAK